MCLECLRRQWHTGELFFLLSMASFSSSHLRRITNIFLINFLRLQQEVFQIFKLLNSTEGAYDN